MRARDLTEDQFLAACRERGWTEGFGGYWVVGWTGRRKLVIRRRGDVKRRDEQLAFMDQDAAQLVASCDAIEQRVLRRRAAAALVQRVSGGGARV